MSPNNRFSLFHLPPPPSLLSLFCLLTSNDVVLVEYQDIPHSSLVPLKFCHAFSSFDIPDSRLFVPAATNNHPPSHSNIQGADIVGVAKQEPLSVLVWSASRSAHVYDGVLSGGDNETFGVLLRRCNVGQGVNE